MSDEAVFSHEFNKSMTEAEMLEDINAKGLPADEFWTVEQVAEDIENARMRRKRKRRRRKGMINLPQL